MSRVATPPLQGERPTLSLQSGARNSTAQHSTAQHSTAQHSTAQGDTETELCMNSTHPTEKKERNSRGRASSLIQPSHHTLSLTLGGETMERGLAGGAAAAPAAGDAPTAAPASHHHSIFTQDVDTTQICICLIGIIIFTMSFEHVLHELHHKLHHNRVSKEGESMDVRCVASLRVWARGARLLGRSLTCKPSPLERRQKWLGLLRSFESELTM